MTEKVVELIRRFSPMSPHSKEWDVLMPGPGRPQRWHEIGDEFRVLIIADPGAGKTFEALTRARRIKERGRHAFFIRIEKIDATFEESFEVGTATEFAAWLASTDEAWFFLDSVDEAQLETPRALEDAIRIFGAKIYAALDRARIFITSREDAWRALPDQTLIEQHLPYGEPAYDAEDDRTSRESDLTLKLYRLAGLSEDEIALFAGHYGVADVTDFVDAVKRANLLTLAERPFDLKALIRVWIADHRLGSRFEVLQRMIALQIKPQSAATGLGRHNIAKMRDGARILAGAVTMTGKTLIGLPTGVHSADRIDPRTLLIGWADAEINTLLRTGLFDDIVYSSVRFRHREIRELLCAEWANDLLNRPGARARVEDLFFRESYGEQVIVPRTRPILPWLILFDEAVRDKALALCPEIASEGGDPSRLPLTVRQAMLHDIVNRIAIGREG
ncbi:hypothetical protein [Burkholderia oklahomensis]|uniref:hypothetical protein n=1 Tax=Burkholderia oklahomensis TaxID=342113 RepID=UPI0003043B50|nr:hypothetical protein [Burkholderia oklahomensis]AOI43260.1 hypothetical protein WG70_27570 [Burkholderia oklahomensis EO147]KUY47541.1 hypothetical protein WG70_22735 [Burkholderia oklahomensis EO147]QPS38004.1 hypothetical protein I6G57_03990 [Burkholderia oklahomensis]